ncbi:Asp-tRNA(Asn)/Glu-tRNA(Gln) amidotransferase subunit GatB [Candidatus Dojkabacteria bacterium]|uniref:Aspartyl/glutamyl-tRNA(Asn/Gln) amidotransferase subunit B n=1 Tax=Candidatus Dojkabacteria bacterium TaxID=2099670 RepID=A0A3M0YZH8_9BACT|nr:MAG: Asp-tRNA(Asn)/Glu-tRNA(Gln) amidotransferase subunit GatB [Candidatus Dojkabacteria bacterium]
MYEPVIGLEIHIQVSTRSKMFCRCPNDYFEQEPNSFTCPVCLGLPGALPVPNFEAFKKAVKLALALNCNINNVTKFDRKNYFYPDLPKGYQISQFDKPIGYDGYVDIEVEGDLRRIRIQRLHLEEDTAKSLHVDNLTLIDFNKSGVPLIEIVTMPDFVSKDEVIAFAKRLRQIVRYTQVSEAEMQKGQMRYEVNISVRKPEQSGSHVLPDYKVEIKNIGSISVLEKVVTLEFQRQVDILSRGGNITRHTRGLKNMSGETIFQRPKEVADDYRYFPEPDIPPIHISSDFIEDIRRTIPILPAQKKYFYTQIGMEQEQADFFVEEMEKSVWIDSYIELVLIGKGLKLDFSNELIRKIKNFVSQSGFNQIKEGVKWFIGDISGLMEKKKIPLNDLSFTQQDLLDLTQLIKDLKITGTIAKIVIEEKIVNKEFRGFSISEVVDKLGLWPSEDVEQLESWVMSCIEENQDIVKSIARNPNAIKALVGKVMRASSGRANPIKAEKIIRDKLGL